LYSILRLIEEPEKFLAVSDWTDFVTREGHGVHHKATVVGAVEVRPRPPSIEGKKHKRQETQENGLRRQIAAAPRARPRSQGTHGVCAREPKEPISPSDGPHRLLEPQDMAAWDASRSQSSSLTGLSQ
jgi:hypothetical protein